MPDNALERPEPSGSSEFSLDQLAIMELTRGLDADRRVLAEVVAKEDLSRKNARRIIHLALKGAWQDVLLAAAAREWLDPDLEIDLAQVEDPEVWAVLITKKTCTLEALRHIAERPLPKKISGDARRRLEKHGIYFVHYEHHVRLS